MWYPLRKQLHVYLGTDSAAPNTTEKKNLLYKCVRNKLNSSKPISVNYCIALPQSKNWRPTEPVDARELLYLHRPTWHLQISRSSSTNQKQTKDSKSGFPKLDCNRTFSFQLLIYNTTILFLEELLQNCLRFSRTLSVQTTQQFEFRPLVVVFCNTRRNRKSYVVEDEC